MNRKLYKTSIVFLLCLSVFSITSFAQNKNYPDQEFRIVVNLGDVTTYLQDDGSLSVRYPRRRQHTDIEYYDRFQNIHKEGKIRKWGNMTFDYYDNYNLSELQGKIKQINNHSITYYDRFALDELRGKVKSIGNIQVTYYDRYDLNELKGKIKSVGALKLEYFDRYASSEKAGMIKSVSGSDKNIYPDFRF